MDKPEFIVDPEWPLEKRDEFASAIMHEVLNHPAVKGDARLSYLIQAAVVVLIHSPKDLNKNLPFIAEEIGYKVIKAKH